MGKLGWVALLGKNSEKEEIEGQSVELIRTVVRRQLGGLVVYAGFFYMKGQLSKRVGWQGWLALA